MINSKNLMDDTKYSIQTSSGGPPNKHFFQYYKTITIDHNQVIGMGTHTNFPFLFSIFDKDLKDHAQSDGDDIAFANDTIWFDHEIELFNPVYNSTHAQLIAWIRIPNLLTSIDTVIHMYYGNSTMVSQENPEDVWGSNFKGVWHLSENPSNPPPQMKDSTSNNHHGFAINLDPSDQINGQIDGSIDFDFGIKDYIYCGDNSSLDVGKGNFSLSLWFKYDGAKDGYLTGKGARIGGVKYSIWITSTNRLRGEINDGSSNKYIETSFPVDDNIWHYVVLVRDEYFLRLYIDGYEYALSSIPSYGSLDNAEPFYINAITDFPGGSPTSSSSAHLDEVRLSDSAYSAGRFATEYNNQYHPINFFTIGSESIIDNIPPTYSNLIESSDPLELGETEVIKINVSDPSGINQVKIEFEGSNHSMTNIGGDTWQYDSWSPINVGNYTYTIWMEDNSHNWNFTRGTIEVIDTTSPTYSDLIESADPLQLGQNETITIKVYDSPGSGVNQVILEYDSSNHTMIFIGGHKWSWNKWKPTSLGIHSYKIFMQDKENNWNMTSGTINVVSTTAPVLENLSESVDPLELGNNITISIDAFDIETSVSTVLIELDGANHTMINIGGRTYEFNWTRLYVGIVYYTIYANDTENNWNYLTSSFDIVDTTPPALSALVKSEEPLEFGDTIIISVNSTDLSDIYEVRIEFETSNEPMTNIEGNMWQYDLWSPSTTGILSFTIWAKDNNDNWNFLSDSILVQDTILPMYSDLTESTNPVELGFPLTISINCTDLASIKGVSIEYQNDNHTMTHTGGDIWQYSSWMPISIGNYTYMIYITDNNDNLNYVGSWILFQDTIIPTYSNLFESADPLELGENQIIRLNVYDFAGINQSLVEFEGMNHSMVNIYGNTWQFDTWTPNNWILYQYRIHMEDKSGNWNILKGNITVQDTIPPSPPVFANSPSGDVSGIIVFDWLDGSDPSGISYYILIIDNEADPFTTPGFVHIFNITNIGPESSYCMLPQNLSLGDYFYFLAQADGVGQLSTYTIGAFTLIKVENGTPGDYPFLFWIILISIILLSVLASLTVRSYIILPKKRRKESELSARTQRFKDLRNIQAIIIIQKLSGVPIFSKSYSILEKNQNDLFSGFIQAITTISEEFSENKSVDTEKVEKIIELDLKHFKCLISDEGNVRVAFVLKEKSSERLKRQIRAFVTALNLNFYEELENWDGSLDKFQSLIPSILNEYFELYYKGLFTITDAASRRKICKVHELSSMEKRILSIIDPFMKHEISFYLDKILELIVEQNENSVIDAIESLIKKELILPTEK